MIFRTLREYPNYEIYEDGTVIRREHTSKGGFHLKRKQILPCPMKKKEYMQVYLKDLHGNRKANYLHRLVYEAFNGEIPQGYEIDHINGDRKDCSLQNLKLCNHKENCRNPISIARYKEANQLSKGKFDRKRMMAAQTAEYEQMLKEVYSSICERYGMCKVWWLMNEGRCGYPRAVRIVAEMRAA